MLVIEYGDARQDGLYMALCDAVGAPYDAGRVIVEAGYASPYVTGRELLQAVDEDQNTTVMAIEAHDEDRLRIAVVWVAWGRTRCAVTVPPAAVGVPDEEEVAAQISLPENSRLVTA